MNKKQWIGLLILYIAYLLFGALVFKYLEEEGENLTIAKRIAEYKDIIRLMNEMNITNESTLDLLTDYCEKPFRNLTYPELQEIWAPMWDYYNSVFFVITVVSTIGYGNLHPTQVASRLIMIFYAIIGIPLNGILLTSLAGFFSKVFVRAHKKYKRYESRFGLAVDILTYLVPGMLLFIFLPACAFCWFEEWSFDESVYFAFVTLTTIGFGDLVAGQKTLKEFDHNLIVVYKILLLCWIVFGLGYLIMLLNFVTRAMRSKKMVQLEHKLVEALTHSRIWHGFSKDIGYMRRIMNELYLDKFKPVFHDETCQPQKHIFQRSKSLPNIPIGLTQEELPKESFAFKRRRANSDYVPYKRPGLARVFSENDLLRIDRRATFATAALIEPAELLRHVVDAMGGSLGHSQDIPSDELRGIDVFSDDEILRSEGWYDPKNTSIPSLHYPPPYEDIMPPTRARGRAFSECPAPPSNGHTVTSSTNLEGTEWTWSGTAAPKMSDIIKDRFKKNLRENAKVSNQTGSSPALIGGKWLNPLRKRKRYTSEGHELSNPKISIYPNGDIKNTDTIVSRKDFLHVPADLHVKRRSLQDNLLTRERSDGNYMTHTAGAGIQGFGLMHGRQGLTRPEQSLISLYNSGDHFFSDGNGPERRELLEQTSLADFLRVLTSLHNRVGERIASEDFKPKRKLGNASLTPPKFNSLFDLFPPPSSSQPPPPSTEPTSPKSPTKRKFSLMPNIFLPSSSRRNSLRQNTPPEDSGTFPEKSYETSNLKRLGRFILRSYSLTPKTDSNPDVSLIQRDSYRLKNRKRLSLKPGESQLASSPIPDNQESVNCSIRIQIDSPENRDNLKGTPLNSSDDVFSIDSGIVRSSTTDPGSRLASCRRGSSPASVIDMNPFFKDRFRKTSTSSESLYSPAGSTRLSNPRQPISRFTPSRHPEPCSAKPGLDDVKEVTK